MIRIKKFFESAMDPNQTDSLEDIEKNMSEEDKVETLLYYAFDWDDNILKMPTKILMDQKVGEEWLPVEVSTAEFAIVRNDPDYRVRNESFVEAFSQFRDNGPRGDLAFSEDMQMAIENNSYAPAWDDFIECLTSGCIFYIITARGHESQSMRNGVEWIIDNILTYEQASEMFYNCQRYNYLFGMKDTEERILKGKPSQNLTIKGYLDLCGFVGVSAPSRGGSPANPEKAKEDVFLSFCEEIQEYIDTLNEKWYDLGVTWVAKLGFSDDDLKNEKHVNDVLANLHHEEFSNIQEFTVKGTKNPQNINVTRYARDNRPVNQKKFNESSHRAAGLDSSVTSMMPQTSLSQRFFTNTKDAADSMHKQSINFNGLARDLYSKFGKTSNESQPKKFKNKKKVVKKLKSFESFMDTEKSREEMILQLCNSGYERWELDGYSDMELKDMCREVPEETVSEKWKGDVEVQQTGEHAGKNITEINAEIKKLKQKTEKIKEQGKKVPKTLRSKMSQLYFAKRAKQGWKKGKGSSKV
jgi:hypothetical protein